MREITVKLDVTKSPMYVDNSCLSTFQRCHRRAYWQYVRQLRAKSEAFPLLFGAAMHQALFVWNTTRNTTLTMDEWKKAVVQRNIPATGNEPHNLVNGVFILDAYMKKYAEDAAAEEVINCEVGFDISFPGVSGVQVVGKLDYAATRRGKVILRDHKTTQQMGPSFPKRARPNNQFTLYTWAFEHVTGKRVDLFELDGIQVAKTKSDLVRVPVTRLQYDIDQMLNDFSRTLAEVKLCDPTDVNSWSRCTNECFMCPYHSLCSLSNPDPLIEASYEKSEWRPFDD